MKKEELDKRLKEIETEKNTVSAGKINDPQRVIYHQVELNEFFIELINDFNEVTSRYNRWLIGLTVVIALLTLVMVAKMVF